MNKILPAYLNLDIKNIEGEEWLDVPNFVGVYQVSNKFRVKRVERKSIKNRLLEEQIIKQIVSNKNNKIIFRVYLRKEDRVFNFSIERLYKISLEGEDINYNPEYSLDIDDLEGEIWKTIPDYKGIYLVSNFKRVKRISNNYNSMPDKILKCYKVKSECGVREYVNLVKNNKQKRPNTRNLYLKAFFNK